MGSGRSRSRGRWRWRVGDDDLAPRYRGVCRAPSESRFSSRSSGRHPAPLREIRGTAEGTGGDDRARPAVGRPDDRRPSRHGRALAQRRAPVRGLVEAEGSPHGGTARASHARATPAARPVPSLSGPDRGAPRSRQPARIQEWRARPHLLDAVRPDRGRGAADQRGGQAPSTGRRSGGRSAHHPPNHVPPAPAPPPLPPPPPRGEGRARPPPRLAGAPAPPLPPPPTGPAAPPRGAPDTTSPTSRGGPAPPPRSGPPPPAPPPAPAAARASTTCATGSPPRP